MLRIVIISLIISATSATVFCQIDSAFLIIGPQVLVKGEMKVDTIIIIDHPYATFNTWQSHNGFIINSTEVQGCYVVMSKTNAELVISGKENSLTLLISNIPIDNRSANSDVKVIVELKPTIIKRISLVIKKINNNYFLTYL